MKELISKIKKRIPFLSGFKGSADYWESRYVSGGNSGAGSYNNLAVFKAEVLNEFFEKNNIKTTIEFGCGDGNQLDLLKVDNYTGLDVSSYIIEKNKERFKDDETKTFSVLDDYSNEKADLTLSLDVIFHLVEDEVFENYMKTLFEASNRYVIVYSSDYDDYQNTASHVRHRKFTNWVETHIKNYKQIEHIPNKFPFDKNNQEFTSKADFFVYRKND